MNKKVKKLGLLIVAAIAMAMGVNSANALKIDGNAITSDTTVSDNAGNTVTVDETNATSFVITVNGPFADAIVVEAADYVTINLNGKSFMGSIDNSGVLVINGNTASYVKGSLTNTTGTMTINGGNYAYTNYTKTAGTVAINGVGTVVKAGMDSDVNTAKYKAVAKDGYYVLAEADASLVDLIDALNGNGTYSTVTPASTILASEANYVKATFANWKAAYNTAKALVDANAQAALPISRQAEVNAALAAYINAYNNVLTKADYTVVNTAIANAKAAVAQGNAAGIIYTDASMKVLNDAIAKANANRELPLSKQADVDAMAAAIDNALAALVWKADYSKINDLESVINGLKAEQYTTETWTVLTYVRSTIERDLAANNQNRVDYFYRQLFTAVKGLKRSANQTINNGGNTTNPSNPSNPGTTNNGGSTNVPGTVVNPNTNASGTTGVVDTGDNVATYAVMNIVSLIALAGCGLVLRKQN